MPVFRCEKVHLGMRSALCGDARWILRSRAELSVRCVAGDRCAGLAPIDSTVSECPPMLTFWRARMRPGRTAIDRHKHRSIGVCDSLA
jgi:hypothetical protein